MTAIRMRVVAAAVLTLCAATHAPAASKFWKNSSASGAWSSGSNWSAISAAGVDDAGVPAAADNVNLAPTDGVGRAITYDYAGTPITLGGVLVDLTGPGSERTTFSMSAGALTNIGFIIANTGRATFNHSGGTFTANDPAFDGAIGYGAGSSGVYNLSGSAALSVAKDLYVGNAGTGTLTIQDNASAYITNNLSIGSTSTVNLNGGTLRFSTIGGTGGLSRINYSGGTIRLAGNREILQDPTVRALYGVNPTVSTGRGLIIEGTASIAVGTSDQVVRVNGGSLSTGSLELHMGGLEITDGGTVSSGHSFIARSSPDVVVTVSGRSSTWNIGGNELYVGGFGGAATLNIRDGALVNVGTTLSIFQSGVVNLAGGTLRFGGYQRQGISNFRFNSGTIQLSGNRSIGADAAILDILGGSPSLTNGKGLTVEGTATLLTAFTLDGGTFTANALVGGNHLQLHRGTLNVIGQAVTIGPGGLLGAALDLKEDMTVNVSLGVTNQGLVTGDGQIGGTFTNAAGGELRAQAGRSLRLTGSGNTNAGQIKLLGGELEFTQNLTNSAGAFISGNGSLIVGGGLVNQGTMNFAGTANVLGDVTNAPGGKISSGGGGATIFFDDVTNNGEIRTSTNGFTVLFGSVSGAGPFTGTGTVNIEGDLQPGNSPAAVQFSGNVVFGPGSTLHMEVGGTTPGTGHDQLQVAGSLIFDGTLDISLISGFVPTAGQSVELFTFSSSSGRFLNITGDDFGGGLYLKALYTASGLSLMTTQAGEGDADLNGLVNADDFVLTDRGFLGGLSGWGNGDFNHDGLVNIADFFLIDRAYSSRPAGPAVPVSVPEPAVAMVAALGINSLMRRRTRPEARCRAVELAATQKPGRSIA